MITPYQYPYIRLKIKLTHRNKSTNNAKKQQSQYESLYNIPTTNKELLNVG